MRCCNYPECANPWPCRTHKEWNDGPPAEPAVPEREPHGAICEGCGRPKPIILNTYVPICAACHQPYSVAAAPRAAGGQRVTAKMLMEAAAIVNDEGLWKFDQPKWYEAMADAVVHLLAPQVERGGKT